VGFVFVWLALGAFYLLLAGEFSPDELGAAVLSGLIAAIWSASLKRAACIRFRFNRASLAAVRCAIAGLTAATVRVAAALCGLLVARKMAAPRLGQIVQEPFVHGRRLNPVDTGRRAIAVLARSLAPDSFVIRTQEGREEMDLHNVLGASATKNTRWKR
jgi:hypothetical protein